VGAVFFLWWCEIRRMSVFLPSLGRNALGTGWRTLELLALIEERALLAAVEFELHFGALAVGGIRVLGVRTAPQLESARAGTGGRPCAGCCGP